MMFDRSINDSVVTKLRRQVDDKMKNRVTPYLTIDLDIIREKYKTLRTSMPKVACYYSVKSNPLVEIIKTLLAEGANFEAASIGEIEICLAVGVKSENIHYGNSVKAQSSIDKAIKFGVSSFAFDCEEELAKLQRSVGDGATLVCRLTTDGEGATWGLCNKFGCDVAMAKSLLRSASKLGKYKLGLSFHVGSQQCSPDAWRRALMDVRAIIDELEQENIVIGLINVGGGFPASGYLDIEHEVITYDTKAYFKQINDLITNILGARVSKLMCEPGRYILSEAGSITTSVILVTDRHYKNSACRWLYLDIGKFNGLYEGTDIVHPVTIPSIGGELVDTILSGPSCDSDDMLMCGDKPYRLPGSICTGDELVIGCTGAYSTSYMTCGFNGFAPLDVYYKNK